MNLLSIQNIKRNIMEISIVLTLSSSIPFLFHLAGLEGIRFLPIYLAILIGGYFVSLNSILIVSLLTPLFNYLLTGMPIHTPLPILQILTLELFVLAFAVSVIKEKNLNLIFKLALPILVARVSSIVMILFYKNLTLNWFIDSRITGISGIILNVILAYLIVGKFNDKKRSK